ncbi:hypothetical protein L0Z42_29290 [Burkholderia multivorans]|nr:hypothetical protein [Burkholderia multivorans]EEE13702.1 hypothetical protein BURMUCGD2M_6423 [Burkholderia multivorans CGD2M]MCO1374586.1 hypothetical protein [Burkholderia multivorans]MCO1459837.1 hypothetical protein [Burkholderia multivorans]MCO1470770.1 hypothetical protein [Burkholderia multivorans]MDN7610693.1 hypothetical protein [Burkholderia multivorans]
MSAEISRRRVAATVAAASAAVDQAVNAPEDERAKLLRKLDVATAELIEAVAQVTRAAQG